MPLVPRVSDSSYIKLFLFHGVHLDRQGSQYAGECPFLQCRNDSHETPINFFVNPATGLWDCKKCGRSGNVYDFIRQFYGDCLAQTTDDDYNILSEARPGIFSDVLKHFGLAYNYLNDEWLIPTYSQQRTKLINLYAWKQQATVAGPIMVVMGSPGFKQVMFGLSDLRKVRHRPLILCEGPWDLFAVWDLLHLSNPKTNKPYIDTYDVLGVPGTTIPNEDLPLMAGRDLIVLGDNDLAGASMPEKTINRLCRVSLYPATLTFLTWDSFPTANYAYRFTDDKAKKAFPEGTQNPPQGYDVRDLFIDSPSPQEAISYILDHQVIHKFDKELSAAVNYDPKVKPLPCEHYQEVVESCKKDLFLPECLYDTLAVMLAIAATVSLKSHPLWAYIVGPPSSGKTTLLGLVSAAQPHCFGMTTWTGLVSGFQREGLGDASILPKLNGKCVTIEDFTPTLNEPKPVQDRLFGELRDIYDGKTAKFYRNHENRVFENQKFHILACVTDRIRGSSNTDLGERFLHVDQDSYWSENGTRIRDGVDKTVLMDSAMASVLDEIGFVSDMPKLLEQRAMCWGLLDHVVNRIKDDRMWVQAKTISYQNSDMPTYVQGLSSWVAYARTIVSRDRNKHLLFRPRAEYGTRVMKQLTKLAIALSLIFDESFPSPRMKAIIRKVALDSSDVFQQEIMLNIAHNGSVASAEIARILNIPDTHAYTLLKDMQELGIAKSARHQAHGVGQPKLLYSFTPELQQISDCCLFTKKQQPTQRRIKVTD